jgi:hypothetical protein
MDAQLSAGYCGERSAEAFMRGVRAKIYPAPAVDRKRRKLWLRDDLDRVIKPSSPFAAVADVAEDL